MMTVAGERWSPWRAISELEHVDVVHAILPEVVGGGICARLGGRIVVVLDRRLPRADRRCVLAHELVHLERDSLDCCVYGQPDDRWTSVMVREEMKVNREVARRLVPELELAQLIQAEVGLGQGVRPDIVAEHFEVTERIAETAMEAFAQRIRRLVA